MARRPATGYATAAAAHAFAAFTAQADGEKALIWSYVRRFLANAHPRRPPRCLDFGCGSGWLARQIAAEFGFPTVGYDPSVQMVAKAGENHPNGVTFTSSLDDLAAAGPFDMAFMIFVVPALKSQSVLRKALRSAAGLLTENARLISVSANTDVVFARHSFSESRRGKGPIEPGATYETDILSASGKTLVTVTDHYWPSGHICDGAARAGFRLLSEARIADHHDLRDANALPYLALEFARKK